LNKWARVDYERCNPQECGEDGCKAAQACTHKLLEQEDPSESPMLLSVKMCVGCGKCVQVCPCGAIDIASGSL
jgi:translation initiation factor RLI1